MQMVLVRIQPPQPIIGSGSAGLLDHMSQDSSPLIQSLTSLKWHSEASSLTVSRPTSRRERKPFMNVCGKNIRVQGRLIQTARLADDKYEFLDDPEALLDGLRKSGTRIDLFTFMQKLPDTTPKYRYPMEWDNVAALPVSTFDHWWTKQVDSDVRTKVRKAEKKGVVVREVPFDDALVRGIWEIYNECPIRQGTPFVHYGMDIERVRRYAETFPSNSLFIGAYFQDRLIGFIKLICHENRTQADTLHVIAMVKHREKAPTNALIAQAVRSCAGRGIPYLVYSNFAYGKKQRSSLSDFKQRNGFQKVDLPRYYVPLTLTGWAALRLGLHRRFADHLPGPVAEKLRELRTAWYTRKFQTAMKAS